MRKRTMYTAEFKRQALELADRPDIGSRRAAQDLGINRPPAKVPRSPA
ncbi:hypothetical protein [Deinococcus sp. 6GRE01]|nr:hypothetical protein [Deinococcus sp. 6GRE01]MCD0155930.1 hypothetical protein [Deinococcus sp. 6GRE01]